MRPPLHWCFRCGVLAALVCLLPVGMPRAEGGGPLLPDFQKLAGDWRRTDGRYVLKVGEIGTDGRVRAEYFNPGPVGVTASEASMQQGLMRLLVLLEGAGYEGSSYTLYYYAAKDALAGFYHQGPTNRTYEVVFFRAGGE